MAKTTRAAKKRIVKVEPLGRAYIHASFNNIIVTLTNNPGQVISWASAGKMGFKGSKKNTPYAAQMAAEECSKVAFDQGLRKVKVFVKGPGAGRESSARVAPGVPRRPWRAKTPPGLPHPPRTREPNTLYPTSQRPSSAWYHDHT